MMHKQTMRLSYEDWRELQRIRGELGIGSATEAIRYLIRNYCPVPQTADEQTVNEQKAREMLRHVQSEIGSYLSRTEPPSRPYNPGIDWPEDFLPLESD